MIIRDDRRDAAIERMADHLLAHGLDGARLRALAAAAGTSDRMLLYYFTDRDELLTATLQRIAARLTAMLDAAIPPGVKLPYVPLLSAVWQAMRSPLLAPYMRIWLELAAGAARQRNPERGIATAIITGFADWAAQHLDGSDDEAALLLATVDGMLLLDAAGRSDLADRAARAVAGMTAMIGAPSHAA